MTTEPTATITRPEPERLSVYRSGSGRAWVAEPAPDHAVVEISQLLDWAKMNACVLVCSTGHCGPFGTSKRCRGHAPTTALDGEHLVIGQAPSRAVYRVRDQIKGTASLVLARVA
jgi:hypothetical protein